MLLPHSPTFIFRVFVASELKILSVPNVQKGTSGIRKRFEIEYFPKYHSTLARFAGPDFRTVFK